MNKINSIKVFGQLLSLSKYLSTRRILHIVLVFLLMIVGGFCELFSLGALAPFLALISRTEYSNNILTESLFSQLNTISGGQAMLVVTTVFAGSALVAALARTVILWFNMNISARVGTDISCNVFQKILLQDYEYHLQTNSSSIVSSINIDLLKTVSAVRSFLQMCTTIIVSFGLVTGLFHC